MAATGKVLREAGNAATGAARVGAGAWPWLLQRVTAVLIFVFLAIHIWVLHFAVVGEKITFDRVVERLQSPFYIFVDLALLAVLLYHALNGVRVVVTDFKIGARGERVLFWVLVVVGVVGFIYGASALITLITSKASF